MGPAFISIYPLSYHYPLTLHPNPSHGQERRSRTARSAPRYLNEKYHDVEQDMNAVDRNLGTEGTEGAEGTEAVAEDVAGDLDVTSLDEALNPEKPMAEVEVGEGSRAQASVSVDTRLKAAYNKMEKGMSSGGPFESVPPCRHACLWCFWCGVGRGCAGGG